MRRCFPTLLGLSLLLPVPSFAESNEALSTPRDARVDGFARVRGTSSLPVLTDRAPPLMAPDFIWLSHANVSHFKLELPAPGRIATESDARPKDSFSSLGIELEAAVPPLLRYESKDSQVSLLLTPGAGCTACLRLEGVF